MDRSQCPGKPGAHDPVRVGGVWAYKWFDCRCPDASETRRVYEKRGRENRRPPAMVDPTGTRRRLQALARLGYSPMRIGEGSEFHGKHLHEVRKGNTAKVSRLLAQYVVKFYTEHENTLLPLDSSTSQVFNTSRKLGWAPPEAWDWDTIDNPTSTPQHEAPDVGDTSDNWEVDLGLMLSGRHAAVDPKSGPAAGRARHRKMVLQAVGILTDRGLDAVETAKTLKTTERNVVRYRKLLREQRRTNLSGPRAMNISTAETTPSTGTPREAHVA